MYLLSTYITLIVHQLMYCAATAYGYELCTKSDTTDGKSVNNSIVLKKC